MCEARLTNTIMVIMNGSVTKAARASRQFISSMITTTAMILMISGIRVVTLLVNRSLSAFTSPMMRARIFPTGRLSKKEKESF